jgi:hypothetical protein
MMEMERFEKAPVLHDRKAPQHCRLVLPSDFGGDLAPADVRSLPRV